MNRVILLAFALVCIGLLLAGCSSPAQPPAGGGAGTVDNQSAPGGGMDEWEECGPGDDGLYICPVDDVAGAEAPKTG